MNSRHLTRYLGTLLAVYASTLCAPVYAQSSNGTYTLVQDIVSSGGGQLTGNPMSAQTVLGLPASGAASNGTFSLIGGLPVIRVPAG